MRVSIISLTFLFILACNQIGKKKQSFSDESAKVEEKLKDTTSYQTYIEAVFGNIATDFKNENDSVLFFNSYPAKYAENLKEKYVSLRFKECSSVMDSFQLGSGYELLKRNRWFEEALPHEYLFYKRDDYIVVFDCLKYCEGKEPKTFLLEKLRIYKAEDYLKIAKTSNSVSYTLKLID